MLADQAAHGQKGLFARTVCQFPHPFDGQYKDISNTSLLWRNRSDYIALKDRQAREVKLVGFAKSGRVRDNAKFLGGRGRKRALWVSMLHGELLAEFERMRAASVKLSPIVLRQMTIWLIQRAGPESSFSPTIRINGTSIESKATTRCIQGFMASNNLVIRTQTGKLAVSPAKQAFIEKSIAFHLGCVKRDFESGKLQEDLVENADETHFVFDMDNGHTVGLRGDEQVKYSDVLSGDEGVTMMVRITGGVNASIPPMLVFKNPNSSYPIRGVPTSFRFVTALRKKDGRTEECSRSGCPSPELFVP